MNQVFLMMIAQAVLGGFDNLWHHEITERLPARRSAAGELALHSMRELLYAFLFFAFAWYEWYGAWAVLIAAILGIEIVITITDFLVEDRTRRLPPLERVLHTVLAINFGVLLMALVPVLQVWWSHETEVRSVSYGPYSWFFTVAAAGVLAWGVRNAFAVLHLRRPAEWVRDPLTRGKADNPRTILISGATGFIGGHLVRRLIGRGERVIVWARDPDKALDRFGPHVRVVNQLSELTRQERIDSIINLAGAPILGFPWTRARRQRLISSRVESTRALVDLCTRLVRPPKIFVSASAIGYYGVRDDETLTEQAEPQSMFQSRLCQEWETAADAAATAGPRLVKMRIGLVLGRDGGALQQLVMPVRLGLGAVLGRGQQWVSWIHIDDLVRLFEFALDTPGLRGPMNAVSPAAARHEQMQRMIGKVLHRPVWMRVPAFSVRALLGEMAQLLVDGQRVVPARAQAAGFVFRHAHLGEALADLLQGRQPGRLGAQIYYNGECPVCRTEMEHYSALCSTSRPELRFIDSTRSPNDLAVCGLRAEHLEQRVYLLDGSGRILSGMPALISLWSWMPRYRWAATLFSLPLLRQAATVLYDHVVAPSLAFWARTRIP